MREKRNKENEALIIDLQKKIDELQNRIKSIKDYTGRDLIDVVLYFLPDTKHYRQNLTYHNIADSVSVYNYAQTFGSYSVDFSGVYLEYNGHFNDWLLISTADNLVFWRVMDKLKNFIIGHNFRPSFSTSWIWVKTGSEISRYRHAQQILISETNAPYTKEMWDKFESDIQVPEVPDDRVNWCIGREYDYSVGKGYNAVYSLIELTRDGILFSGKKLFVNFVEKHWGRKVTKVGKHYFLSFIDK